MTLREVLMIGKVAIQCESYKQFKHAVDIAIQRGFITEQKGKIIMDGYTSKDNCFTIKGGMYADRKTFLQAHYDVVDFGNVVWDEAD